MRIADTSALYALFDADDAHHDRAREAMGDADPVVVPAEIFAETVSLIQYRVGFDASRKAGDFLRALPHVALRPTPSAVLDAAWAEHRRARGALSYPDAVVVAWCAAETAGALAFDRRLLAATRRDAR